MVVLDELHKKGGLPAPNFIKIDVEGGEMVVLRGLENILNEHHPKMIVATHGDEIHEETMSFLSGKGYKFTPIDQLKGDVETLAIYRSEQGSNALVN